MNRKKIMKGGIGYIDQCKKNQLVKVICWAVIIAAVVGGGWLYFKTRLNMVTILGILLVLPAAKALIALILICHIKAGMRIDLIRSKKRQERQQRCCQIWF